MPKQLNTIDAALHVEAYLPAAGATLYTDSIDLGQVNGGAEPNVFELRVIIGAAALHVDPAKTITARLQDSADDAAYADTNPQIQAQLIGVAVNGSAQTEYRIRVCSNGQRYIRLALTVPAGDGDCTGVLVTVDPCF